MLRLKKLHARDNNSPELQKDYAAERHYSWRDREADHRLLSPLTFTLIKDWTPLLNFPPHCFLMRGWHLAALAFHIDCCEKIWKMQCGKIVMADDKKDQQYIHTNTIVNLPR